MLVQEHVDGPLVMVQAVFADGRLLAWHTNLRARLGAALRWHGALSLDAVLTFDGLRYIDVNPRIVEPGNAWHAGLDLVDVLLRVSLGHPGSAVPPGQAGVLTHQLLAAVLGAAQQRRTRRAVLAELSAAARHRGPYRDSDEELTPLGGDAAAAVPVAAATCALLNAPRLWRAFASNAVANYALTPHAWRTLCTQRGSTDHARASDTDPVPTGPALKAKGAG